jgi:MFS family permease
MYVQQNLHTDKNRTLCDTTMYLYVSEIFPTEIRPIGMGFSLFGQFAATIILLQTAPIGFANVGWKYYLVIIIWCIVFIPIVYFYFPETARLSLEEISAKFGDDVAVHINDVSEEERKTLDEFLKTTDVVHTENVAETVGEKTVVEKTVIDNKA